MRRNSKEIKVGKISIGGNAPISVQSMTSTDTRDIKSTIKQIKELEKSGCEIIRIAVPDMEAAKKLKEIRKSTKTPLVADIHYDYRLAIKAVDAGFDKIRINPGNISKPAKVKEIVKACADAHIPIRIGVNVGSIAPKYLEKYGMPTAEGLVESAMDHIKLIEALNFTDIVVAVKSSDVDMMIKANEIIADKISYPLHLGVTEAGPPPEGIVKSSIGIGILLKKGIGDTIRVSLTADPVLEVKIGFEILKSLDIRKKGVNIISCPTCGRIEIDLLRIVEEVKQRTKDIETPLNIAIMGCIVNGPGEARNADVGLAGGKGVGIIFRKGKIIKKVKESAMVDALMEEVYKILDEKNQKNAKNV